MKVILFFLLFFHSAFSQQKKYVVLDEINGELLPFSTIKIVNKKIGVYGSELGVFELPKSVKPTDSLEVSYIGYKTHKLSYQNLKDTVFLVPQINELNEIIIYNDNWKTNIISKIKGKTIDWYVGYNEELTTLVKPNINCNNCILKSITIPIGKKTVKVFEGKPKVIYPKFETNFELNLYSVVANEPSIVSLLNRPIIIKVNQDTSDEIVLDLSKENITLDNNGIYISVEILTSLEEINGNSFLPSFKITNSKDKNSSTTSLYRNIFIDNKWRSIIQRPNFSLKEGSSLVYEIEVLINEN
jgi:hypothetical protein